MGVGSCDLVSADVLMALLAASLVVKRVKAKVKMKNSTKTTSQAR